MEAENRAADRRTDHDHTRSELHELADVERLLHLDTRAQDPTVQIGKHGARVSWDSWEHNSHSRGSLTASVVNEIAASDAWGVATIHDPLTRDDGLTQSMLSIVYIPRADR